MSVVVETIASTVGSDTSFVDLPSPGPTVGPCVTVAGWFVIAKRARDVRVIVSLRTLGDKRLTEAIVGPRNDVHAGVLLADDVTAYGYEARVHGYDLPPKFELEVRSHFEQEEQPQEILLASIAGTNQLHAPTREAAFAPVYVVGLARSGTTVLTRMIGAHPAIACGDKYPLELCASAFYAKMARLAASTADLAGYSKSNLFAENDLLGPNPFASLNHVDRDVLDEIVRQSSDVYIRAAADATDAWYGTLARTHLSKRAALFVEKSQPGSVLVSSLNVYPRARCILLVRDPRDSFLSKARFNRKRGTKDFGERVARDVAHWAELHIEDHRALIDHYGAFRERFVEVVRYEDLMDNPLQVMSRICTALGVDRSDDVLASMIEVGKDASGHFAEHRTSNGGNDSVPNDEIQSLLPVIVGQLRSFFYDYGYTD